VGVLLSVDVSLRVCVWLCMEYRVSVCLLYFEDVFALDVRVGFFVVVCGVGCCCWCVLCLLHLFLGCCWVIEVYRCLFCGVR